MADLTHVIAELADIKSSIKALAKLLRKLRTTQDDPDGEKAKTRASNNGFNRPLEVSPKLRLFLGLADDELISRSEVTRRINAYVTANNLKHPDNGRVIILDEKLTELLEPPSGLQITFLNVQKYLSPHYLKNIKVVPDVVVKSEEEPPPTPKVKRPAVKKTKAVAVAVA
jgi:upstream activation factor subunit UAF30